MTIIEMPPALPDVLFSDEVELVDNADQFLRIMRGAYLRPSSDIEIWQQKHELTLARCLAA